MIKILLCFISVFFIHQINVFAQCSTCIPDETCTSTNGLPAVCPLVQPNATAGVYYEEQITFFMPTEIEDPGSGITATLISVTFTSVAGLPFGIEYTLNDDDATYYPSNGENYGCATMCGTPLLPGTYSVVITVSALANAFGFEVTQVETFESVLIVDPGQGAVSSFSYDNIAACGGLNVNYDALLEVPAPSVVEYDWDFGNGQTSSEQHPNTVFYDDLGDYETTLTTTIYDWSLDAVSISSLNDNWSGDFDDLISTADPYFQIFDGDGNVVYASATIDNTVNAAWSNINLMLTNPPYAMTFFDDDDFTDDDNLGSADISLTEGLNFFDTGNGTTGVINILLNQSNAFTDSVTVSVFPLPNASLTQNGTLLTFEDPELTSFTWYLNNTPIQDATSASYTMVAGGEYHAVVGNQYGCTAVSATILYCPEFEISFDVPALEVYVADIYETYQWFFNGLEVDGANSSYLAVTESGNYAVEVTTSYGCTTTSEVYTVDLAVNEKIASSLKVYPNPAGNTLFIQLDTNSKQEAVAFYDLTGRVIAIVPIQFNAGTKSVDVSALAQGIYFAEVNNQRIRFVKR